MEGREDEGESEDLGGNAVERRQEGEDKGSTTEEVDDGGVGMGER